MKWGRKGAPPLLFFVLVIQFSSLRSQWGFPEKGKFNTSSHIVFEKRINFCIIPADGKNKGSPKSDDKSDDWTQKSKGSPKSDDKSDDWAPKSKYGGSTFKAEMNMTFKMDTFMPMPDWLQAAEIGKFVWNAINLFVNKGLFFSEDKDRDSSPFNMQPRDKMFKGKNPLGINDDGESYDHLLTLFENVIYLSPHRAHPWYLKRDAAGYEINKRFSPSFTLSAILPPTLILIFLKVWTRMPLLWISFQLYILRIALGNRLHS